ncbi:MAG: response regulator transcription factor [Anaerolineae bacterium]|nr:response regulator transcription factor [Anaerolineae bacterium]
MAQRILLVDDEMSVLKSVRAYLEREGFVVATAEDGLTAVQLARSFQPNLIILDVMLPGQDGFGVLRTIRRNSDVYVLMLTASAGEIDRVVGLELGADDYLTKPFSPRELVARVKAILRRGRNASSTEPLLTFGGLQIDPGAHRVWKNGEEIELTPTEYDLLFTLSRHNGRVLSRQQLIEHVWGYNYFGDERIIDVHIRRLRLKIEDDSQQPQYIVTVRGAGYRFDGGTA